jgi:hypothetical protein
VYSTVHIVPLAPFRLPFCPTDHQYYWVRMAISRLVPCIAVLFSILDLLSVVEGSVNFLIVGDWGGLPIPPYYSSGIGSAHRK